MRSLRPSASSSLLVLTCAPTKSIEILPSRCDVFLFRLFAKRRYATAPPAAAAVSASIPLSSSSSSQRISEFFRSNGELASNTRNYSARSAPFTPAALCHPPPPPISPRRPPSIYSSYFQLAKPRLTALIVLSTMSAYAITPESAIISNMSHFPLSSLSTLFFLTVGTTLTSAAANALNMAREPEYDGMMSRTRTRPIVRGFVSPLQAVYFAIATGAVGTGMLLYGVNEQVALLAVANIALYAGLYTSMKRTSILNTWVGAVVGAIPPLMGWSAAGGSLLDPGAWCLAGLLYAWQFPHFNALSYNIREEYRNAGYRMAAWVNPALNARVSLRYSVAMIPLCVGLWYFGVTDAGFVIDSTAANAWLVACAVSFWKECRPGGRGGAAASASARKLFWASIMQLPAVLVLAMVHKAGFWQGVYDYLQEALGAAEDEEEEDGEEVEQEHIVTVAKG
ncbi:UbiA prenyltransferase family-domain-containing protein [Myxozyma melibiosi]|uniref:Protoheme IX farnesyltransferase, mitochondrial n=1 Tax=Myxozyma melibiosi TaxID=54550 RepID=A0ABR1F039_9ASCO